MACNEARELLGKFHDRELQDREYQAVAEHLKGCIHCAQEMKKLEGVGRLLKNHYGAVSASEDFSGLWARVFAGLDAAPPVAIPFSRRFTKILRLPKPVWAGIAAAAAALVLLLAYPPGTQKPAVAANECIIDKVNAQNGSVMVYETDETKMKIIWVMENG